MKDAVLGAGNEIDDTGLVVPEQLGETTWTVLFPGYVLGRVAHDPSSISLKTESVPHTTSVAAWDIPSPVVAGGQLTLRVGVKCATQCRLAGQLVEVCDESGTKAAEGTLQEVPWRGTDALYATEVTLTAPPIVGMHSWSVVFRAENATPPHRLSSCAFSFRTVQAPECHVTVSVFDADANVPLEGADVRVGLYRARTDERGQATLDVPKGSYEIDAWKTNFEADARTVDVAEDLALVVEARPVPITDPDFERTWM